MPEAWTPEDLRRFDSDDELLIAARRLDGGLQRRLPIWVVTVEGQVYVRTWHRRDTGWFAHVLQSRAASVSVPGVQADVTVEDVGAGPVGLRAGIDAAYRTKYDRYGPGAVGPMVSAAAAATTLRLVPASVPSPAPTAQPGAARPERGS